MPNIYLRQRVANNEIHRVEDICARAQIPKNEMSRDERLIALGSAITLQHLDLLKKGEIWDRAEDLGLLDEWDMQTVRDNRRGYTS